MSPSDRRVLGVGMLCVVAGAAFASDPPGAPPPHRWVTEHIPSSVPGHDAYAFFVRELSDPASHGGALPSRVVARALSSGGDAYRDAALARVVQAYANALFVEGDSARAAPIYDRLAEAAATPAIRAEAMRERAKLDLFRFGDAPAAARRFEALAAFVRESDDPEIAALRPVYLASAYFHGATALQRSGRPREAITTRSRLFGLDLAESDRFLTLDAWVGNARDWSLLGRPGKAVEAYTSAIEWATTQRDAGGPSASRYDVDELRYARVLASDAPPGSRARLDLLRAFVDEADDPAGHRVFTARLRLAQAEFRSGDADAGRAELDAVRADLAALLSDPALAVPPHRMLVNTFAEVSTDLALIEIRSGRPDLALLLLDELDAIAPAHGVEHDLRELAEAAARRAAR